MRRDLVVTFCNKDYVPVLANFLAAPGAPQINRFRVYCLDIETSAFADRMGIESVQVEWDGDFGSLWQKRVQIFSELTLAGQDFVHTDVDALWLENPLTVVSQLDADLAFSQGTIHPSDVLSKWGFVLCCGFFAVKAGDASLRFLTKLAEHVQETGDDQTSTNQLLAQAGMEWQGTSKPDYRLEVLDQRFNCWLTERYGRCEAWDLSVALLPHGTFQRIPDPIGDLRRVHLKHPLSSKEASKKLEEFEKQNLFFLQDAGSSVP